MFSLFGLAKGFVEVEFVFTTKEIEIALLITAENCKKGLIKNLNWE